MDFFLLLYHILNILPVLILNHNLNTFDLKWKDDAIELDIKQVLWTFKILFFIGFVIDNSILKHFQKFNMFIKMIFVIQFTLLNHYIGKDILLSLRAPIIIYFIGILMKKYIKITDIDSDYENIEDLKNKENNIKTSLFDFNKTINKITTTNLESNILSRLIEIK